MRSSLCRARVGACLSLLAILLVSAISCEISSEDAAGGASRPASPQVVVVQTAGPPVGRMAVISDLTERNEVFVLDKEKVPRQITNIAAIPNEVTWIESKHRTDDGKWKTTRTPRTSKASVHACALSPDGEWVTYVLDPPSREGLEIWVAAADGEREPCRLTTGWFDRQPCWSPDSTRIAFKRRSDADDRFSDDIYVVSRDKPATEKVLAELEGEWDVGMLAWSPDGKRMLIERLNPPPGTGRSIWRLDIASGEVERIPIKASTVARPVWFPDGSRIVYCAIKRPLPGTWQIYTNTPDGGDEQWVLKTRYIAMHPTISPDGRYIAFLRLFGSPFRGRTRIGVFDTQTGVVTQLTPGGKVSWDYPSWGRCPDEADEAGEE
jgi:Tol biopolymer transport system component